MILSVSLIAASAYASCSLLPSRVFYAVVDRAQAKSLKKQGFFKLAGAFSCRIAICRKQAPASVYASCSLLPSRVFYAVVDRAQAKSLKKQGFFKLAGAFSCRIVICRKQAPASVYASCSLLPSRRFLTAVESISLIRFNWFTSLAPGS